MSLLGGVLRWAGVGSVPEPAAKPETDWAVVGCEESCRWEHSLSLPCRYSDRRPRVETAPAPVPGWVPSLAVFRSCGEAEQEALVRLADLTASHGPWDAASRVFGGAGEVPDVPGAGLSATLAGEPAESVPR